MCGFKTTTGFSTTILEMASAHQHGGSLDSNFYTWLDEVINSTTGFPITVMVMIVLSITCEALDAFLNRLQTQPLFWIRSRQTTLVLHNILSTLTHGLRMSGMFILMVVFMYLNPWLCTAIIIGAVVGHLIFHWSSSWASEAPDKEGLARSQW